MKHCPCGFDKNYNDCCGRYIESQENASTPELLMRSRYTAYTLANIDYIVKTMKYKAAEHFDAADAKQWAESVTWLGLKVLNASMENARGNVEFIAYYQAGNQQHELHEKSEFVCENGKWFYIDGSHF